MRRILLLLLCGGLCVLSSCTTKLEPEMLYGKTKEEVLELAFLRCRKNRHDELVISAMTILPNPPHIEWKRNFFHKSSEEAIKNKQLMESNTWKILDGVQWPTLNLQTKQECYKIYFKDDKVIKAEKAYYYTF